MQDIAYIDVEYTSEAVIQLLCHCNTAVNLAEGLLSQPMLPSSLTLFIVKSVQ